MSDAKDRTDQTARRAEQGRSLKRRTPWVTTVDKSTTTRTHLPPPCSGAADDLERYLTEQVEERPYITLGVAAGVGYVLGGGLRSRLTAVLLGAATRLAMAVAARELAARLSPGAAASAHNKSS